MRLDEAKLGNPRTERGMLLVQSQIKEDVGNYNLFTYEKFIFSTVNIRSVVVCVTCGYEQYKH